MRVIAKATLRRFWDGHPSARGPLAAWHGEASQARWTGPADIRAHYRSADFLPGNRVVFNIGGNRYRLVVRIVYATEQHPKGIVFIRFVGTHAEYDRIDATTV